MLALVGTVLMSSGLVLVTAPAATANSEMCPAGYVKGDSSSGTVNGAFGTLTWSGSTLTYDLAAGYVVDLCLKSGSKSGTVTYPGRTGSGSVQTGEYEGGKHQQISHIGYRVATRPTEPDPQRVRPNVDKVDLCGTAHDSFAVTNAAADGVTRFTWSETGIPGGVRLTFQAAPGFALDGPASVDVTFTDEACPPTLVDVPAEPEVLDPCGPDNNSFVLPADTDALDWERAGDDVTVAPQPGHAFEGAQLRTFVLPADTNQACPEDDEDEVDVPAEPEVLDPCGPGNNAFAARVDGNGLDWTLLGNGDLTVQPLPGFEFRGGDKVVTFELPADTNVACPQVNQEIAVPAQPAVLDPCGPDNNSFEARADTAQLDWTVVGRNLQVAPKAGFRFAGNQQVLTFTLPADSNVDCVMATPPATPPTVAGVQEVVPAVSFTDPTCDAKDAAAWSGTFTDVVDYTVSGEVAPGESVVVTASLDPAVSGYALAAGAATTFEHAFAGVGATQCGVVKGVQETKGVKPAHAPAQAPVRAPVVLGTQAAVPTAVAAGLGSLPAAGPAQGDLLGRTLTVGGLGLLLAAGWLAKGRRQPGLREV